MSDIEEPPAKVLKIDNGTELLDGAEAASADDSDLTEVSDTGELADIGTSELAESSEMAEASDIIGVSDIGAAPSITEVSDIAVSEMGMPEIQESEMAPVSDIGLSNITEEPGITEADISVSDLMGVSDMDGADLAGEIENMAPVSGHTTDPTVSETAADTHTVDALDSAGVEAPEPPVESQESQESQENQENQESQESQESQDNQESQESQESQDNQESQESQESQENQESQEGQEEWLSEGVLTDDDFNPAAVQTDSQTSQLENGHGTTTKIEIEVPMLDQSNKASIFKENSAKSVQQNIEDALNTLEGGPEKDEQNDDLDKYLVKKPDIKTESADVKSENLKQEQDDGNDTDDLLRMLGEDDSKAKKKLTKTVKDIRNAVKVKCVSSDDDEFVFEGAAAKKLKIAKSLSKKPAKAEPEDSDPTAGLRMFRHNKHEPVKSAAKQVIKKPARYGTKDIVNVVEMPKKDKMATSTPLRPNKTRSLLKTNINPRQISSEVKTADGQSVQVKKEPIGGLKTYSRTKNPVQTSTTLKSSEPEKLKPITEEYLDDDFDLLDDEFESEFEDDDTKRQRATKHDRMEEENISEGDSHSEDGSLYDELPSSDSEGLEDWFQLDIRAEKAGDYIPLLGSKAKELLMEEKKRCATRLANLKHSLSALTDSGKKQAVLVRTATMQLAELDDMLKST